MIFDLREIVQRSEMRQAETDQMFKAFEQNLLKALEEV